MEDRDYKFAPLISKDVASALARSLDRQFDRGLLEMRYMIRL